MALMQQKLPIFGARLTVRCLSSSDVGRAAVEGVASLPCVRDFVQGPLFVRGPSAQVSVSYVVENNLEHPADGYLGLAYASSPVICLLTLTRCCIRF